MHPEEVQRIPFSIEYFFNLEDKVNGDERIREGINLSFERNRTIFTLRGRQVRLLFVIKRVSFIIKVSLMVMH